MTPFYRNVQLAGVTVGELRVRRLGPSPLDSARITFVDTQMNPVSFSIFSAFSLKTRKLIELTCSSIEEDFLAILSVPEDPGGEGSEAEAEDEGGVSFP